MDFCLKIMFFKAKCRIGWTRYKHKCLKFFDNLASHSLSEQICQSIGGTLISIHSAEENKFAVDLANKEKTRNTFVWIGAKRNNPLENFEWTNGKEFNYSNWRNGEPKNSIYPKSEVLIYNDGTWAARSKITLVALFICESGLSDE
jgi:hypothetical protein